MSRVPIGAIFRQKPGSASERPAVLNKSWPALMLVLGIGFLALGASTPRAVTGTPDSLATVDPSPTALHLPSLRPRMGPVSGPFNPEYASLELEADGVPVHFSVQAFPALPGQIIRLEPVRSAGAVRVLHYQAGEVVEDGPGWSWTAPLDPGAYALSVTDPATSERVDITVLVAHPAVMVEDGSIHGYRLGKYMAKPLRGNPAYLPPQGFIEVPPELNELTVSPHFTLGQFLCKQEGDRKFLLLSPALLTKLEIGLERFNDAGFDAGSFHVMSGYRTPAYNRAIGNTTSYSRHLYGDAADIFVDTDGDGYMDDLTGDGRADAADARFLLAFFRDMEAEGHSHITPGGLGVYGPKPHRGPFVHVDTRGTHARW